MNPLTDFVKRDKCGSRNARSGYSYYTLQCFRVKQPPDYRFAPLELVPTVHLSHFVSCLQQCQLVVRTVTSVKVISLFTQSQFSTKGHCLIGHDLSKFV